MPPPRRPPAFPLTPMPPTRAPAGPQAGGSQPSTEAPVARAGRTNNNATGAPRKGAQHAGGGAENAPPEHEGAGTPSAPAATAAGVGNAAVVQKPVAWWHFQGQLAGSTAQSALAKGEKVTAEDSEAPANVAAAGQVAVDAWQTGFMSCFKFEPNKYAAGVPLANSRKRKSKEPDEPKEGRAALESDRGKAELSAFVYHHVREEFFLTKDGCKNELFYWLTDKERDYAIDEEKEYDPWWVEVGQRAVNKKGVTARASMMARVKECIWREYSASSRAMLPAAPLTHALARSWRHPCHVHRPPGQEEEVRLHHGDGHCRHGAAHQVAVAQDGR